MPTEFSLRGGDILLKAQYAQPAFTLFNDARLQPELYSRLLPFGAQLAAMRYDLGNGGLGETNLQCPLFEFGAILRVYIDRADVQCFDLKRIRPDLRAASTLLAAAAKQALEGIATVVEGGFSSYSLMLNYQLDLSGVTAREHLAAFTVPPPDMEWRHLASGVIAYFAGEGNPTSVGVFLEPSLSEESLILARVNLNWEARALAPSALGDEIAACLPRLLVRYGLIPHGLVPQVATHPTPDTRAIS